MERKLERLDSQLFPQFSPDYFLTHDDVDALSSSSCGSSIQTRVLDSRCVYSLSPLDYSLLNSHFPPTFSPTNDRRSSVIPQFFFLSDPVG